jgi:hypothetical protein
MLVPATYGWPGGLSEPMKVNESLSSWECITLSLISSGVPSMGMSPNVEIVSSPPSTLW